MVAARGYITISNVQAIEGKDAVVYKLLVSKTLVTSIDDMINVKLMKTVGDKSYIYPDDILFLTSEDRQRIIYSYDGTTDYTAHSSQILYGTTFRYGDYCKSGKFLNLVLINNCNSKVLDVVTIMEARKGEDGEPGHSPYIQDDYWWVWDTDQNKYVNSGNKVKGEDGVNGKDAVSYKLMPVVERAYITGSERNSAWADVYLSYKVQKSVGEKVVLVNPSGEGLNLYTSAMLYKASDGIETYFEHDYYYNRLGATEQITVTLSRGDEVLDTRIVNLTFKPSVVFNVDKELGTVTSNIQSLDGKHNTLKQTIEALTSEVANKASKTQIRQTAEEIALEVVDNSKGRQNLLVGSGFRNESEVSWNNNRLPSLISRQVNFDGTNSIHIKAPKTTEDMYQGIWWEEVNVTAGKTYNFSFQAYLSGTAAKPYYQIKYRAVGDKGWKAAAGGMIVFGRKSEWRLNQVDVSVPEGITSLLIMIFSSNEGDFYIARPMFKEGAGYTRWTLSQFDYDYVGGNMLDGTKNLDGAHITKKLGVLKSYSDGKSLQYSADADTYFLTWGYDNLLVPDSDYIVSYMAKGEGVLTTQLYGCSAQTILFSETSDGNYSKDSYGASRNKLTSSWKRHWVRFRTTNNIAGPFSLGFRLTQAGYMAEVAEVKLEEGCLNTPYTHSYKTLVNEDVFKKAGLNLREGRIEATADNFIIRNNEGEVTLFIDDKGRINNNILSSRWILKEPLIITKDNWREYVKPYNGGYELDILKAGTFVIFDRAEHNSPAITVRLPYSEFLKYNNYQKFMMAQQMVGNSILLFNAAGGNIIIDTLWRFRDESLRQILESEARDRKNLSFKKSYPLRSKELWSAECKVGIISGDAYYRYPGVYWECEGAICE